MPATTVTLETPDGPMPAYQATPQGAARGGVVVIQEAFGVTEHIEEVCRRFAAAGWSAVAPALFHRQGSPALSYDDRERLMPLMGKLSAEGIDLDVDAALAHLASLGFGAQRCAIVGFCMGGTVSFFTAHRLALGAASTFYGGGIAQGRFGYPTQLEVASELKTPWLGLYGDLDKGIPVDDVERLRAGAADAEVPTEVVRYAAADHGFHCDDRPAVFNRDAAADAWQRTLAWFDRHVTAG
jgi:carboxymethylenebutenolidase